MATATKTRTRRASSSVTKAAANIQVDALTMPPMYLLEQQRNPKGGDPYKELGTTGLRQYGGFVVEEWLRNLQGKQEPWAYREMIDNDPVVGGIMFAIKMLARKAMWWAEGHEGKNDPRTDFIWSCMHDMSQTWVDFLCEALSMVGYGWSYHELCYKKRNGPQKDTWTSEELTTGWHSTIGEGEEDSSPASSKFKDGKIGWRKLPVRGQETLLRWHFQGYAGIRAMEQIDWHGAAHVIPIQKALLFRTETTKNNPQGRSALRNCWVPYYSKKNIEALEAIGIERDLAGIPVAIPPEDVDIFSEVNKPLLQEVRKMVTAIRRDEYEGVVLPAGWKLELLRSGGSRQIDTDQIVRRYEQRIAASVLADFILVGLDAMGSYAMVDVKSDLFGVAMDTFLDLICEPINSYAIPRLLALNGMSVENPPRVCHSSAGRIDLEKVGTFFREISMAGAPIPWSKELIGQLFSEAGLPASFEGEALDTMQHPTGDVHMLGQTPQNRRPAERQNELSPAEQRQRQLPQPGRTSHQEKAETVDVAKALAPRAASLSVQLEREIGAALDHLGRDAAHAYVSVAQKADRSQVARIVAGVIRALNLKGWIQSRLEPLLRNHAARVTDDTRRTIQTVVGEEIHLAEDDVQRVAMKAGLHLRASDIEPQIRKAIMSAIEQAHAAGDNPTKTAARIRSLVPDGRFTGAGAAYRSQLIARNETADLQRGASLASYKAMRNVHSVQLRDGIYGPPRSDAHCIERDGEIVPLDEADTVVPYHPLCTLGFSPVVG